jgi:hypothetical protein
VILRAPTSVGASLAQGAGVIRAAVKAARTIEVAARTIEIKVGVAGEGARMPLAVVDADEVVAAKRSR